MTSDQIKFEEKPELCNAVSRRGRPCKYKATKDGKCGRCIRKRSTPKPFKKGIDNPRGLNFGGRGWSTFLDQKIASLAQTVLSTPDYLNLTQEIEYANVRLAAIARRLDGGTGLCFEKWNEILSLMEELKACYNSGENEKVGEILEQIGKNIEFCAENYELRKELHQMMNHKADFIKRQMNIKENENMYVPLEQMLVFGAQLVQVFDAVLPKHDKQARKYRQALFSLLAPKFGSVIPRRNRLTPMPDDMTYTDDDFISDEELELLQDLSED